MKKKLLILLLLIISLFSFLTIFNFLSPDKRVLGEKIITPKKSHWFVLHRKSNKEFLYYGVLGDLNNSRLVREFQVKPGSATSPTPLPELLGKEYWLITKRESSIDNPETAPYFLTLDIPAGSEWPYGPVPYEECKDPFTGTPVQCDWVLPGYFGLHGVNGNSLKLSNEDLGSSGCIRHSDRDISYLYNLLNPETEEIRYYIKDI